MYHDVIGGKRDGLPEDKILPGVNFRMAELPAAVAQVHEREATLNASSVDITAGKCIALPAEHAACQCSAIIQSASARCDAPSQLQQ